MFLIPGFLIFFVSKRLIYFPQPDSPSHVLAVQIISVFTSSTTLFITLINCDSNLIIQTSLVIISFENSYTISARMLRLVKSTFFRRSISFFETLFHFHSFSDDLFESFTFSSNKSQLPRAVPHQTDFSVPFLCHNSC